MVSSEYFNRSLDEQIAAPSLTMVELYYTTYGRLI
jgi:hypothetical protein